MGNGSSPRDLLPPTLPRHPPVSPSSSHTSSSLHVVGPDFGHRLRQLLRAAPHVAIHYLEGRSDEATGRYLDQEGIMSPAAWKVISQLHKHERPIRLYREATALVRAAQGDKRLGALRCMSHEVLAETLTQLTLANSAVNGMLSSVNPQKLPFPYVQLIQWATKLVALVIITDFSIDIAEYSIHNRQQFPFSCPAHQQLTQKCGTSSMIFLTFTTLFFAYVIFGLMDLHGALANPYKLKTGNVQQGILIGLERITAGLVEEESLPL